MIRELIYQDVSNEYIGKLDTYLRNVGETVLNHRYPSLTQDHADFNAVTVRGSGYTISAFFPSFRKGGRFGAPEPGSPLVTIGIGADDPNILNTIEAGLRNVFAPTQYTC